MRTRILPQDTRNLPRQLRLWLVRSKDVWRCRKHGQIQDVGMRCPRCPSRDGGFFLRRLNHALRQIEYLGGWIVADLMWFRLPWRRRLDDVRRGKGLRIGSSRRPRPMRPVAELIALEDGLERSAKMWPVVDAEVQPRRPA